MKNLSNLEPGEKAVIDSFSDKELALKLSAPNPSLAEPSWKK